MKNKLSDLNDHLFAAIERLNDESLAGENLDAEIGRSKAITGVAKEIISNAGTVLRAEELRAEYARGATNIPKFITNETANDAA